MLRNQPSSIDAPPPLPRAGLALLMRVFLKRAASDAGAGASPPVPRTVFACTAPDPAHLARYQALLGFAPERVPLTWYYLLVQRAHLATMLDAAFPFRLLGMVHVENELVEYAPAAPGAPLRLVTTVRIEPPTASGARFCVLETDVFAGGRRVLKCGSKYLAQAGRRAGAAPARPGAAPSGEAFGGWRVGQGEGRAYARVSGDWNPIHLARWTARLFGLRAPIIHGMHSVAKAVALLEAKEGRRVTAVSVRFRAAAPLGSALRMLHAPGTPAFVLVCDGRLAVEGSVASGQDVCAPESNPQ